MMDDEKLKSKLSAIIPDAESLEDAEYPEQCPDDLVEVANDLRSAHHQEIAGSRIRYVFEAMANSHGVVQLGKAHKCSPRDWLLIGAEFVIRLNGEAWMRLEPAQRLALLDHELYHCTVSDEHEPAIRKHDVEEFGEVVHHHGLWTESLVDFGDAIAKQLQLFETT